MLSFRGFRRVRAPGTPVFLSARVPFSSVSRSLLPVACRSFFISRHLCIAWSVGVTVINDVMSLTRYTRAGSRESRYDRKRQKPDD